MRVRKILSIAIVSALLAACSSSGGGGGNGIRPGPSSLSSVLAQYRSDVSKAKTIDLVEEDNGDIYSVVINGKATGKYNFSDLSNGRTDNLPVSSSLKTAQGETTSYSGTMLVYQQPYSVVTGITWTQGSGVEFKTNHLNVFYADEALGFATPASALTKLIDEDAIFDYKGVAFDGKEEATLNYRMAFGQRTGYGSITGFTRTGSIYLAPAQLDSRWTIEGQASLEKDKNNSYVEYELSFFGPNAEEIAGSVHDDGNWQEDKGILGNSEIIFAGSGKNILP